MFFPVFLIFNKIFDFFKINKEKQEYMSEIQLLSENVDLAEQEIKRLQDLKHKEIEEIEGKHKEELKKYQKYLEEKASVSHSLDKKLQKFEENHNKLLIELEKKKDELSETLGVC